MPTARLTRYQSLKANTVKPTNLKDHPQKDQEILGNQDAETETDHKLHYTKDGPHKNDLLFAASTTPARWPNYILYTIYTENTQEDSSDTLHEYDDHNTSNPFFLAHYHGTKKNLPPPVTSNTITTISNKTTTATTTTTTKETTIPPTTLNCTPSGYSAHQKVHRINPPSGPPTLVVLLRKL